MGLTRREFMFSSKHRDKVNSEIDRVEKMKRDIGALDYALKNPKDVGAYGVHINAHGKYLRGKDLKEYKRRVKLDNSKKYRHPEYLDYDDFNKWVENATRLNRLGEKGAKIRRDQLVSQYEKFVSV